MGQARVRDARGYGHAMEDHAVAYFEFVNGGKGLLDGGVAMNGAQRMIVVGTEGTIRIHGENKLEIDTAGGRAIEESGDSMSLEWSPIWDACLDDLLTWLDGGDEPRIGFSRTAGSAELNLAAYLSALRGDRIDLPLDASQFTDVECFPVDLISRRSLSRGKAGLL
jgi:predicted dehydrogenase